jgi:hypothetical protein
MRKRENCQGDKVITLPTLLHGLLGTYSADYITLSVNNATLIRDTIDNTFKSYFQNGSSIKCMGENTMIQYYSDCFVKMGPSLSNHGKHADFLAISNKSNHLLSFLEVKFPSTKHLGQLTMK